MIRTKAALSTVALLGFLAACSDITAPSAQIGAQPRLAKGGGEVAPPPTVPSLPVCANITVLNTGASVRKAVMPDIKYSVEGCGTSAATVTVSVKESASSWSTVCPSPVAAAMQYTLAPKQKIVATAPVYRGGCGFSSNVNGVLVQSTYAWQGHNLVLTVTDNATGAVLSSGFYSWQDVLINGV